MATVGEFYTCSEEDLLFGGEYVNSDFFSDGGVGPQHLYEHNYATNDRMSVATTSSSNSLEPNSAEFCRETAPADFLMTPAIDDLAFVDDLVPICIEQDSQPTSNSLSSSCSVESVAKESTMILLPPVQSQEESVDPLPDLCALVDRETLMEALCLVEMPPTTPTGNNLLLVQEPTDEGKEVEPTTTSLVSTLFDFISSGSAFSIGKSTERKTSLLPLYADESEESFSPAERITTRNRNSSSKSSPAAAEVDVITDEERAMMAREGCVLPLPSSAEEAIVLTEEQEKVLKSVRRKMRNKESAKESRKRKADYIDTLEKRVKLESGSNTKLRTRVQELEQANEALTARLHYMQGFVQKLINGVRGQGPGSAQKSTCFFVMFFALCLIIAPRNGLLSLPSAGHTGDSLSVIDNNSALPSPFEVASQSVESAIEPSQSQQLIPQSFIFTYEASIADRAADL